MIDLICLWEEITKEVNLSTNLYEVAIEEMKKLKKAVKKISSKSLSEFMTNVIDMAGVNGDKRQNIQEFKIEK